MPRPKEREPVAKARYECRYPFSVTADLKPRSGRENVPMRDFEIGDEVPENVVKASPDLLDELPGRGTCVVKVEGS